MTETYLDTWTRDRKHTQGVTRSIAGLLAAGIGGRDASTLARGVDVSHWQGAVNIQQMVNEGGISFCFPKASDGYQVRAGDPTQPKWYVDDRLHETIQKCYDAKIVCAPYHYVQPHIEGYHAQGIVDWNMTTFREAVGRLTPGKSYQALVLDFEEKTTTNPNGAYVVKGMIDAIQKDPRLGTVPIIVYTSIGVLSHYTDLREYLGSPDCPVYLWMAQWSYTKAGTPSWSQLMDILRDLSMSVQTPGWANWKFLQWSASLKLPGCDGRLDQDLYNGTREHLYSWLKFEGSEVEPPVPPDPEPVTGQVWTIKSTRNIRIAPTTKVYNVVGQVKAGTQITVTELVSADGWIWGKTDAGWVSLAKSDYAEPVKVSPL